MPENNVWDDLVQWADDEIGSVDELGHYAYVTVTELTAEDVDDCPDPGHYIIHTDSLGFVRPTNEWPMTMMEAIDQWGEITQAYDDYDSE